MILTLGLTSAVNGDTFRLGVSGAADFGMTKHFCRLTCSSILFQTAGKCPLTLGWFPYSNARSRSAPVAAACTGTPPGDYPE